MNRRASETSVTGSSGQSLVYGTFQGMGWASCPMPGEHDNGTDVWLGARDARRFELGVLLGGQVKTGPSYFKEPVKGDDGAVTGWWFRDTDGHKDYWCDHRIPHIIVLRDNESNVAYWAHLKHEKFISTGKGNKIFVDVNSKVDLEHNDELVEIAVTGFQPPSWEGSAWETEPPISSDAHIRYALLTPRIVSPHPNSGIRDLTPYQAIAVLMQIRLENLQHSKDRINVLDPKLLCEAPAWEWRFYASLYSWVLDSNIDTLTECIDTAEKEDQRIAATICLAVAHFEAGDVAEALTLLKRELENDDASAVDQAWLLAHISQCNYELGNMSEALECALLAYKIRYEVASDPTAQAIAAGASYLIFFTDKEVEVEVEVEVEEKGLNEYWGKLEKAIESNDTVSTWWRSQTLVSGLGRQMDEVFEDWSGDSVSYTYDQASRSFIAAMLQAGLSANRSSWSYPASLYARRLLMDCEGDEDIKKALNLLRLSASKKHLKLAINALLRTGPVAPIITMGSKLDLNRSTTTTILSDICFVTESADVLKTKDCNRQALWAIAALSESDAKFAHDILEMLREITSRCDRSTRSEIKKFIVDLPTVDDCITARQYAEILSQIEPEEWTDVEINTLSNRNSDHKDLKIEIKSLLVIKKPELRDNLLAGIKAGDLSALQNFGPVDNLPSDAARDIVLHLDNKVSTQVAECERGQALDGGIDLHSLALVNLWHPDIAKWNSVRLAIESDYYCASRLERTLLLLARAAEMVPAEIREVLRSGLEVVVCRPQVTNNHNPFARKVDLKSKAQILLNRFFPDEINTAELRRQLTNTDPLIRAAAAQCIGDSTVDCKSNLSLLGALARDPAKIVRKTSIIGLASWVVSGKEMPDSLDVLKVFLAEHGPQVGLWASAVFKSEIKDTDSAALLRDFLNRHPSASVRETVANMA